MTEFAAVGYMAGLSDLSPEEVELGCQGALKRTRFMPTVADIRDALAAEREMMLEPLHTPQTNCERCLGMGWWKPPTYDHAIRCKHNLQIGGILSDDSGV